jgi:opacity protein-like surface antigen
MKSWLALLIGSVWLGLGLSAAQAAVPFASPEQDRAAKQATPPAGKALLYLYRLDANEPDTAPVIWINGHPTGEFGSKTYGMWTIQPGSLDIRAGKADANSLTIVCEDGRVYFIQMVVEKDGRVTLHPTTYGQGRKDVQAARLVQVPAIAAAAPAATAPPAKDPQVMSQSEADIGKLGLSLTFKVGVFFPVNRSQIINSVDRKLSATSYLYGLQGEWHHKTGYAIGLELFGHAHDYTSIASSESGDVDLSYAMVNLKYYFDTGTIIQPYFGVGVGRTVASFSAGGSGGVQGDFDSNAAQFVAGAVIRTKFIEIYSEYKYLHDEFTVGGNNVRASGNGLLLGGRLTF